MRQAAGKSNTRVTASHAIHVVVPPSDVMLATELQACVMQATKSQVPIHVRGLDERSLVAAGFPPLRRLGASQQWIASKGDLGASSNFVRFLVPELLARASVGSSEELMLYLDVDMIVTCDVFALFLAAPRLFRHHPHATIAAVR